MGASYYLMPPFHSFRVSAVVDRWDLALDVLAGVVDSVLIQAVRNGRRLAHRNALAEGANRTSSVGRSPRPGSMGGTTHGVPR